MPVMKCILVCVEMPESQQSAASTGWFAFMEGLKANPEIIKGGQQLVANVWLFNGLSAILQVARLVSLCESSNVKLEYKVLALAEAPEICE